MEPVYYKLVGLSDICYWQLPDFEFRPIMIDALEASPDFLDHWDDYQGAVTVSTF